MNVPAKELVKTKTAEAIFTYSHGSTSQTVVGGNSMYYQVVPVLTITQPAPPAPVIMSWIRLRVKVMVKVRVTPE